MIISKWIFAKEGSFFISVLVIITLFLVGSNYSDKLYMKKIIDDSIFFYQASFGGNIDYLWSERTGDYVSVKNDERVFRIISNEINTDINFHELAKKNDFIVKNKNTDVFFLLKKGNTYIFKNEL